MFTKDCRPDIAERYECATNSSDLTLRASELPPGDPDVLVAVAWSRRSGTPLLRLSAQWLDDHRRSKHAQPAERVAPLRELPAVRALLIIHACKWGIEDAETKAADVLRYWLDPVCNVCHGTRMQLIPGTNQQSRVCCLACRGKGRKAVPYGDEGARLLNYLDSCKGRTQQGMRNRLTAPATSA